MKLPSLQQRTVAEDPSRIAVRLPLGDALGALHPGGCFPLVEDPRDQARASIIGMMVLRPADAAWLPACVEKEIPAGLRAVRRWCYDVSGVGGSWPLSGSNALDAYRLALQYGTVDAVLVGASTIAREGVAAGARRGHLWLPYGPLSWPALSSRRDELARAIAGVRRDWQDLGVLSARRYPAQIAITRRGGPSPEHGDVLEARIFRETHPDGSAVEAWVLTSEEGAAQLLARARAKGMRIAGRVLACSPPGCPSEIDVAAVPAFLRRKLDARLVEHDGGAVSLGAFLAAGAIGQLNLTLMRGRSVREVLAGSTRLPADVRDSVLASWNGRARLFPPPDGTLPQQWEPFYAVAEDAPDAEAVVVSFDVRAR